MWLSNVDKSISLVNSLPAVQSSNRSTDTQEDKVSELRLNDTPKQAIVGSGETESVIISNYDQLSKFMPGLNFIRNQVIKPLLFATEKVFESYFYEGQPQKERHNQTVSSINHQNEDSVSDNNSIRNRLNELTLDNQDNNTSSGQYKKRRFRELDQCWLINDEVQETLIATHKSTPSDDPKSIKSGNKREVKLEKKLISKMCQEIDNLKSQSLLPHQGFRQSETVSG